MKELRKENNIEKERKYQRKKERIKERCSYFISKLFCNNTWIHN